MKRNRAPWKSEIKTKCWGKAQQLRPHLCKEKQLSFRSETVHRNMKFYVNKRSSVHYITGRLTIFS